MVINTVTKIATWHYKKRHDNITVSRNWHVLIKLLKQTMINKNQKYFFTFGIVCIHVDVSRAECPWRARCVSFMSIVLFQSSGNGQCPMGMDNRKSYLRQAEQCNHGPYPTYGSLSSIQRCIMRPMLYVRLRHPRVRNSYYVL